MNKPTTPQQQAARLQQAAEAFGGAAAAIQQAMGHAAPPPGPRVRQIGIAPWLVHGDEAAPATPHRESAEERHYRTGFIDGWKQGAFDVFVLGLVVGGGSGGLLLWVIAKGGQL